MGGEIGFKVSRILQDRHMVSPYTDLNGDRVKLDLSLKSDKDDYFHICGDNDWGYLAVELLMPIIETAHRLLEQIENELMKMPYYPEVIMLGKNEWRVFDIYYMLTGNNLTQREIQNIPIVKSNKSREIRYVGQKSKETELLFQ